MDLDEFYARGDARRQARMDGRVRRRAANAIILLAGAALAYYVVQTIVWGVS
jgi:hypothetical protein